MIIKPNLFTPEINQWINENLNRGCKKEDLKKSLLQVGWPSDQASLLLKLASEQLYVQPLPLKPNILNTNDTYHTPSEDSNIHTILDKDVLVKTVFNMKNVDIKVYENIITNEEIDFLKASVKEKLAPSMVMAEKSGVFEFHTARTSHSSFLKLGSDPILEKLEQRIAVVTKTEVNQGEDLQVLHYSPNQEYKAHFDFFERKHLKDSRGLAQGNRIGTLIFYLNDVEEGGGTYFPKLDITIHPHKNSALWFGYPNNDERTLHAGLPVIKGEKWIATKWIRERSFT